MIFNNFKEKNQDPKKAKLAQDKLAEREKTNKLSEPNLECICLLLLFQFS